MNHHAQPASPHKIAAKACKNHLPALFKHTILQLFIHVLALAPMIVLSFGVTYGCPEKFRFFIALLLYIPLYVFLVLPFKIKTNRFLYSLVTNQQQSASVSFRKNLKRSIRRAAGALPFVLLLILYLGGFYYLWNIGDFTMLPNIIRQIGAMVGGDYLHGGLIALVSFIIALRMAIYGIRYEMALEYLPDTSVQFSKSICKKQKHSLNKVTIKNIGIVFPAVLLVFVMMGIELSANLTGSFKWDTIMVVTTITSLDFSQTTLWASLAIFVIAYLPFILYRKAAIAACMADGVRNHVEN